MTTQVMTFELMALLETRLRRGCGRGVFALHKRDGRARRDPGGEDTAMASSPT